jgi:hypothetical protein
MTTVDEWGRGRGGNRRPTFEVARTIIGKDPDSTEGTPIILPPIEQVKQRMTKEVRADGPPIIAQIDRTVKTGAAERVTNKPLDEDLKRTRIYGNRPPVVTDQPAPTTNAPTTTSMPAGETKDTRRTGAVNRPISRPAQQPENTTPPIIAPQTEERKPDVPPQRPERRAEPPRVEPRVDQPRIEPQRRVETPKYEPPPRTESPKYEPPPRREEPRSEPKPRSEPPPQKSEPKVDKPSSPPTKKDGR